VALINSRRLIATPISAADVLKKLTPAKVIITGPKAIKTSFVMWPKHTAQKRGLRAGWATILVRLDMQMKILSWGAGLPPTIVKSGGRGGGCTR